MEGKFYLEPFSFQEKKKREEERRKTVARENMNSREKI